MSRLVLRHRSAPAIHPLKHRTLIQLDDFLEFRTHNIDDLVISQVQHSFVARASQEAAQNSFVRRRAVRKLVVHKRARQHAAAFAARHQEPEARRQLLELVHVIAQRDGNRRAIGNAEQVIGEIAVNPF